MSTDAEPCPASSCEFKIVPLQCIRPDQSQIRKHFDDIEELAESIRQHGLLQPLVVSPTNDGRFRIIAGERRYRACQICNVSNVPVLVRSPDEHERIKLQLVENLHRRSIDPIEEANALKRLMDEFGVSQRQLARDLQRSPATINETLRILSLPEEVLLAGKEHGLSKSQLLEMAKCNRPAVETAENCVKKTSSVRQARADRHAKEAVKPLEFETSVGKVLLVLPSRHVAKTDIIRILDEIADELASAECGWV